MKIAIATNEVGTRDSGHAGQTRRRLVFDCVPGEALPETRFDVTTTLCKLRDLFSRH